jgi:uncharacterized protein (DUF1015 family)
MYDQRVAGTLGNLIAPPYDVISDDERRGYLAASPYNAVRLELPELPYDEVRALVEAWLTDGILRVTDEPVLVAWTQTFLMGGRTVERRSLLASVGVEPYEARVVRPHERTHAGPKEDRLRLIRATRLNISPVYGLYPDPEGVVWAAAAPIGPPLGEMTDVDGTLHRIWVIRDPAVTAAVADAMADRWILIADGHHRYETAVNYQRERGAGGAQDYVMMGLTALDDPGLLVLPTHRVLAQWPDGADAGFERLSVSSLAALEAALDHARDDESAFGLVTRDGFALLTKAVDAGTSPSARLDTSVLERDILVSAFGRDQATLSHDGLLTYVKDSTEAARLVSNGTAAAALLMRPTSKRQVAEVADAGETMPQKSTYFFPKLLTGVAFNPLD